MKNQKIFTIKEKCPKCNSSNINFDFNTDIGFCNNCNTIWCEFNQDLGGIIPKGKPDNSPNNNTPRSSSSAKSSNGES